MIFLYSISVYYHDCLESMLWVYDMSIALNFHNSFYRNSIIFACKIIYFELPITR